MLSYAGEQMTVLFERVGYKTLSVPVVEERKLLKLLPATSPQAARSAS